MSPKSDDKSAQNIPISTRRRAARADTPDAATSESPAESAAESAVPNARQSSAQQDYTPEYSAPGRKSAEQRSAAFNPLAWLIEGATGFVEEARHGDLGLSQDFWKHFYATRRESLLTARALIDSLLEQTERDATQRAEKEARRQRRGTIPINAKE